MNDFTNKNFSQSMVAFQLPVTTVVYSVKAEKQLKLNTHGGWQSFNCRQKITIEKENTVMILMRMNVLVDGADITFRLRINDKFNVSFKVYFQKKSIITSSKLKYARGQGYVLYVLKPGTYNFDIEFKSQSNSVFSVENSAEHQHLGMDILVLD